MAKQHSFQWEAHFVFNVERLRKAEGWSQTDFARRCKEKGLPFHQQTIQRIESGERAVRLDEAFVIAEIFGRSLDSMLASFSGSMQDAVDAIDRVRREASALSESLQESYWDWNDKFEELCSVFQQVFDEAREEPTDEVLWVAAWVLKCGWFAENAIQLDMYGAGLFSKSGDWHDYLGITAPAWDLFAWVGDERHSIWQKVPEQDRPNFLADLNPNDLFEWLSERQDGEHSEASER